MIRPERLETLKFQLEHNGLAPATVERHQRMGIKEDPQHGSMIPITLGELQAFLAAYLKE